MENKTKNTVSIILNLLIVICGCIGLTISAKADGLGMFKYYTQDSNYFALLVSFIYLIFQAKSKFTGKIPSFVRALRFISSSCLFVTFTVVIFVLIPSYGFDSAAGMLFGGSSLYFHTVCPLLAIISFIFFEHEFNFSKKIILVAIIPTLIYAAIILPLNILKVLRGPYPFLYVYEQSVFMSCVWVLVIFGIAALLAFILYTLQKKLRK